MSDTENPDNVRGMPKLRSVSDNPSLGDELDDLGEPISGDNLFSDRGTGEPGDPNRYNRIERVDLDADDDGDVAVPPLGDRPAVGLADRGEDTTALHDTGDDPATAGERAFDDPEADPYGTADGDDTAMLPWTSPATGQVPHALLSDDDDEWASPSWAQKGGSSSVKYRTDATSEFDTDDFDDIADLRDDEPAVGQSDPVSDFFSFDGIDESVRDSRSKLLDMEDAPAAAIDRPALAADADRPTGPDVSGPRLASGAATADGGRNLPLAIGVGVALAVLAFLAFSAGPAVTMVLVGAITAVAAVEFFASARRGGHHPATLLGIVASVALPVATYWKGPDAFPLVLGLTVMFGLLWYLIGVEFERPAPNLGITMLGVGYVGVLISFAALILRGANGTNILLAAIITTVGYDVGAYFVGRNAGRSPLSVASPNKTVEGLLGGCFTAVLAAILFVSDLLPISDGIAPFAGFADALLLGVVVALVAPLGDLAESLLKRDFGVKDMGTLLPGHGGVLDRFDGLVFVLPAAYYLSNILG